MLLKNFTNLFSFKLIFLVIFLLPSYSENWHTSSGNYKSLKYSELEKINSANVKDLNLAWIYKNGFNPDEDIYFRYNNQATPVFTGKSLIVTSLDDNIISIDPETGKENWRIKITHPAGKRGLTYFDDNIFVPSGVGIFVISEKTGNFNSQYGKEGLISGKNIEVTFVPPIVLKNKIFVAHKSFIASYDLPSGKINWKLDLNGSRIWSGISFDNDTDTLVFVTSNLVSLIGDTDIKNDYSNSVVLVDAFTGKIKCKFKDTIHDHWDLDMVGNPIIDNFTTGNNKQKKLVYAFSKTGNTFVVDIEECNLFNKDHIEKILTDDNSPLKDQIYSNYQIKINKPEKLINLDYDLDSYLKYISNDKDNFDYIKHITRNSKSGESYIPLSFDYDVIMFGLHGGPEWPGATYDKTNNQIIIPTNHYPWIIRTYFVCCAPNKKKINRKIKEFFNNLSQFKGHSIYKEKCQSCHRKDKNGLYIREFQGDKYVPSLNGITKSNKFNSLDSVKKFKFSHKYSSKINMSENELNILKNYFDSRDKYLVENNLLITRATWQLILDKYGNFASKPPYGKLTAFDVNTGLINWQIPFGEKKMHDGKLLKGDINFGGVLSTAGNLLFATGTPDKNIIAYKSSDGNELWRKKLEYAGSSPPMTYTYKGEQYLIVNSSGGKYYGFEKEMGDAIYAFKLNYK